MPAAETRPIILLLVLAALAILFVQLASEVIEGDTLAFDRAVLVALRTPGEPRVPIGPHWLGKGMTDITALGGGTVLTLMVTATAAYLIAARRPATAAFVIGAVSTGAILSSILKHVFHRARPEVVPHIVAVSSTSFPSGHAMNSAVTYLTLGVLLAKSETRRAVRIYLVALASILVIAIGLSRIYLGVHWPTDVAAGWCVGSLWALFCSAVADAFQSRHKLETE